MSINRFILLAIPTLVVLVFLSIGTYAITHESFINKTHSIDKDLKQNDVRWTGIVAQSGPPLGTRSNLYELWVTSKGTDPFLVKTFATDGFAGVTWEMNEDNGVIVDYWDGGPEGGTLTKFLFDSQGQLQASVTQDSPADWDFTWERYTVSYITDGACKGDQVANESKNTNIFGILIEYGVRGHDEYILPTPASAPCSTYDEGLYNPTIKVNEFNGEELHMTLADGTKATISSVYNAYGQPLRPSVTFGE